MKILDKEEFRIKLEEINHLVENKDYKGAMGVVDSIDLTKQVVVVMISMLGRETPVELELDQIEVAFD